MIMFLQAAGDPGQAFCNFILVCLLDNTVRKHLFGSCFGKMFKKRDFASAESELLLKHDHQRYTEEA